MPTNLAYDYGRYSDERQGKGSSEERQESHFPEFCATHKLTPANDKPMFDRGISAFRGKNFSENAALGKFLKRVQNGEIANGSVLVIDTVDRFSRQEPDLLMNFVRQIMEKGIGIGVVSLGQIFWLKDLSGTAYIVLSTFFWLAHNESKIRSERAKGAVPKMFREKKLRKPHWVRKPELVAAIVHVVDLAIAGHSIRQCLDWLWANTDHPWSVKYLADLFRDRRLVGELKGVKSYYPTIVDENSWARLQASLDSRSSKTFKGCGGPRGEIANVLPTKGWFCRSSTAQGKKYRYLIPQAANDHKIPFTSFRYDYLEHGILRMIRELTPADLYPTSNAASVVSSLENDLASPSRKQDNQYQSQDCGRRRIEGIVRR